MRIKQIVYSILFTFTFFSACYKEYNIYPEPGSDSFNFQVTIEQEELINNSRGVNLSISEPLPRLLFENIFYAVDRFQIRGETTLRFRRKSFSVNLDNPIVFFIEQENKAREFEEFKLISLVFDYTYIENCIALELFRKINLWPTFSFYTEVKLNNNTQGLYLFIEDPEEYFFYQQESDFILRRNYDHRIDQYQINTEFSVKSEQYYINKFNSIYSCIARYSGRELYDSLLNKLDLNQYFAKLAIDILVKNGDYTDEIFFYIKHISDKEIFEIYPWDYDDIFEDLPHEVGRTWGPGSVFGNRAYYSMDDIINDVGFKLLFSIEDDLDYKIAIDEYLYQRYLEILEEVMTIIDAIAIEEIIINTKNQLQPFYDNDTIIAQSQYDDESTNQQLFTANLTEKKQFLLDRREWILNQLSEQKK